MPNFTELLSLVAIVASLFGCLFAVKAADSARAAHLALKALERRTSLREFAITTGSVLVDAKRVNALIGQVILLHRSLAMASGYSQSLELEAHVAEAEKKRLQVNRLVEAATPYANLATSLDQASPDEIERLHVQQTLALKEIQGLREDLDDEHGRVEAERTNLLEQMEKARLASRY